MNPSCAAAVVSLLLVKSLKGLLKRGTSTKTIVVMESASADFNEVPMMRTQTFLLLPSVLFFLFSADALFISSLLFIMISDNFTNRLIETNRSLGFKKKK